MSARLRSDIWVAAYIRRCQSAGSYAVLRRRGSPEAGAIYIKIDRLDGTCRLLGPAPASQMGEHEDARRFLALHDQPTIDPATAEARMKREANFDPDFWFVELEDRDGRDFLDGFA